MQQLSEATIREIIDLSEARLAAIPADQTQDQVLQSILGRPRAEETALHDALDKLSHDQALQLVATMYAGQYLAQNQHPQNSFDVEEDEEAPMETFDDVYKDQIRNFQHTATSTLISMCEQKSLVLHRYLRAAVDRR
jgi:hypothetical protein